MEDEVSNESLGMDLTQNKSFSAPTRCRYHWIQSNGPITTARNDVSAIRCQVDGGHFSIRQEPTRRWSHRICVCWWLRGSNSIWLLHDNFCCDIPFMVLWCHTVVTAAAGTTCLNVHLHVEWTANRCGVALASTPFQLHRIIAQLLII